MKTTAVNVPLPKGELVLVDAVLDGDPDNFKVHYGGEVVEDGRLRVVFPDCAKGAVNLWVQARGYKRSEAIRFNVGDPEGGSVELEPSDVPFM